MKIMPITGNGIAEAVAEAARVVRAGGVAAFPTETFYGLGVRYDDRRALSRLCEIKRRVKDKAVPLIIGHREMVSVVASSSGAMSERLMERFWPGPLTILLPAKEGLPDLITVGTGKVALRMPGASFALDLARTLDFPLTSTSANISGSPPAETPEEVIKYFGNELDILVDGGRTPGGRPSTIVDASGEKLRILRHGAISQEEIHRALAGPANGTVKL